MVGIDVIFLWPVKQKFSCFLPDILFMRSSIQSKKIAVCWKELECLSEAFFAEDTHHQRSTGSSADEMQIQFSLSAPQSV